jgi:5-methylcytosine-specific restriction endonuclease McrA
MTDEVLTKQFEFVKFPKPTPKKPKTMLDYAKNKRLMPKVAKKKKSKTKLPPKINVKKLRKDCVDLAKLVAKTRDRFTDQRSWEKVEGSNCHGSHIIPVSHGNSLKYDPENIITLSYHNHINWWHKNPIEAYEWFKTQFPKRYKYVMARKDKIVKYSVDDLLAIKAKLEKQLKKYEKA